MTALQEFRKRLFCEEETSDQERSIRLVDLMNAIGFSKSQREIQRHDIYLQNVIANIIQTTDRGMLSMTGSTSEGMHGNQDDHDSDFLLTTRQFKLYTPRRNNINNPPLLLLHDNEYHDASCFVEEDEDFPGYVKLSLAEVKTKYYASLVHSKRMYDDKCYLPNSTIMKLLYQQHTEVLQGLTKLEINQTLDLCEKWDIHGPAHTNNLEDKLGHITKIDVVYCIHHDLWPNSAISFITRRRPNNWPSNSMLENIKSQGYDVAPVGHHDSINNDIQWRISFPGEQSLLLDLTDVQIWCYALIKIILRENLNTSQREVVSSFHIKHVVFWCVELCSCQWVYSNYINCLNICLTNLIEMIQVRHIPHFIIEGRNLFNSKMTVSMSTEIVDVLSKYDTTHVFMLDAFDHVFENTHYYKVPLKRYALQSTIKACFKSYLDSFKFFVAAPFYLWDSYIPHNATESLLNYVNILQNLKKVKGVTIQYAVYLVRSMLGFLFYAKYKESYKTELLLASKQLIHKSLNLDYICVKLRAATFFLTNLEYSQSIDICDTFLTFPPRQRVDSSYYEYNEDIWMKVVQPSVGRNTTDGIENIMQAIIAMFSSFVKLKSLPGNCDITQQDPVWIFRYFTNIYFHGLYMDVTFMTAEKWVVPDPIQYELLSLPPDAEYEGFPFSGIHLDPLFVCLQTKLLCYHAMGNVNCMAKMLTLMNSFITKNTFTIKSSCVYLNMFAYCQIKAGHHRQSVKSILQSLRIFPSRYNTASVYLQIVLQILNSLSIYNC